MAKSGPASTLRSGSTAGSAATRLGTGRRRHRDVEGRRLLGCQRSRHRGRAGCNQGLVFYHFGSVANLLLAALDAVSADRLARYQASVEAAASPTELIDAAAAIFREDLEAGYVTVLVELIAGAGATPGLGPEVAARIEPWKRFAQDALDAALGDSPLASFVPSGDVAHGVVALYLGLEMLSHLDGDRAPALALFDHARQLASTPPGPWHAPACDPGPHMSPLRGVRSSRLTRVALTLGRGVEHVAGPRRAHPRVAHARAGRTARPSSCRWGSRSVPRRW